MVSGATSVFSYFFPEPIYPISGDLAPDSVYWFRVYITFCRGCLILAEYHLQAGTSIALQKAIPFFFQADKFWVISHMIRPVDLITMYSLLSFLCCKVGSSVQCDICGISVSRSNILPKIVVLVKACGQKRQTHPYLEHVSVSNKRNHCLF